LQAHSLGRNEVTQQDDLPLTLLFLVTQRWLVSGLTSGAVKG